MNWSRVRLILQREVRDQLRDRRTLFMIFVLPLLLYPLLGMSFFQMSQFLREHSVKALVVGAEGFDGLPPLVADKHFAERLFNDPTKARLLEVETAPAGKYDEASARAEAQGARDVVVYFPPGFAAAVAQPSGVDADPAATPRPIAPQEAALDIKLFYNEAKEASHLAERRASVVLERWREEVIQRNLEARHLPASAAKPFDVASFDVAAEGQGQAALWSRILPFVLLLWALTGAFYPAVDLCAGEKERGTLETLLSSPAERSEIVWGKLLTIMLFSMATAVLNLASLGMTGTLVMRHLERLGPPPLVAVVWLLVALPPVSALFSALCLSLAVFARSTKEGQYYLMPLVLITMPLTMLPMAPGVELNLGNSLIPISGIVLLLRTVLEGNYAAAAPFVAPVAMVTLVCCQFAIRWAAEQFNRESVLFRESERLDLGLWFKQLVRTRQDTPSVAEAVFCGVLILLLGFFMSLSLPSLDSAASLAAVQLVVVATPALIMSVMLTRSPGQTLLLRLPRWWTLPAAVLLAVALNPATCALRSLVLYAYPINEQVAEQLAAITKGMPLATILLFWLLPPVCEELAFRGFILSGLRHSGHKWRAIVISSLFFGASHTILQQSLIASVLGMVLAFLAVQTGSLAPSILFHLAHNGLGLFLGSETMRGPMELARQGHPLWSRLFDPDSPLEQIFRWPVVVIGALLAAALLFCFHNLPYARSREEALEESIRRGASHPVAG